MTTTCPGRRLGASTGYRVQQAAENARRRQLVEAGEFRQLLFIGDAKEGNTTHIDLTPRRQVYQTEDWYT